MQTKLNTEAAKKTVASKAKEDLNLTMETFTKDLSKMENAKGSENPLNTKSKCHLKENGNKTSDGASDAKSGLTRAPSKASGKTEGCKKASMSGQTGLTTKENSMKT